MSAETMAWLAENYQLGIGTISGIIILIYLLVSVLAIRKLYSKRGLILIRGTIPVINIFYLIFGIFGNGKKEVSKKPKIEEKPAQDEGQEQEDDLFKDIV